MRSAFQWFHSLSNPMIPWNCTTVITCCVRCEFGLASGMGYSFHVNSNSPRCYRCDRCDLLCYLCFYFVLYHLGTAGADDELWKLRQEVNNLKETLAMQSAYVQTMAPPSLSAGVQASTGTGTQYYLTVSLYLVCTFWHKFPWYCIKSGSKKI